MQEIHLRTCPRDLIAEFVHEFDDNLSSAFEAVVGLATSDEQWEQAGLKVKQSGLGLTRAGDIANVAYLASRDAAFDDCLALDGGHVWDDGVARGDAGVAIIGEWLGVCVTRVNARMPELARFGFGRRLGIVKQGLLMEVIQKMRRAEMVSGAGLWDKARLQAMSVPRSGSWLDAHPNRALDCQMRRFSTGWGVDWDASFVRNVHARFVWALWTSTGLIVSPVRLGEIKPLTIM
jgi:hypothetical protein